MSTKRSLVDFSHVRGRNDHTWENGRRYHGHVNQFPFPDDSVTTGGISTRILDVAARDGSWIYSVQDHGQYGKAQCTGLEPAWMVNDGGSSPEWIIHEDLEGPWSFTAKQAFHLIHGEALGSSLTDWKGLYTNVIKHLVPGGWVEVLEHDLAFYPRECKEEEMEGKWDAAREWQGLIDEAAKKFGKRINMGSKQKALMEEAGLAEVQEQIFKIPTKEWKDDPTTCENGKFYRFHWTEQLEGYSLRLFTKTLGWSKEDTDDLLKRVLQELALEDLELYSKFYLIIGRKPKDAPRS